MKKKKGLQLKDIILIGILSVLFGVIYLGAVQLGVVLGTVLTPFGLSIFANEIIFGIWFMAAAFAGYIIQTPGVATITEMIAALIEVFMGNYYGPIIFVSGFVQGIGFDAGFAMYRYRRYNWKSLISGAVFATILSYIWGIVRSDFLGLDWKILVGIFVIRLISAIFFSAVLVKLTCDRLEKSGVLASYPLGQSYE
ncbi:ECF transporter S component [Lactococcus nasutitermitis]|uniref:ECF transporter S component n=1 Tax=Lactococcus nasutitermitis TaxID=1652957 RepID=A0ABV9JD60_9LACT|nr:ECF transporter S component [Lactococcus nasutitermitis]